MIRIATINDIDILVKLRMELLDEVNNNIENYNWGKYSQILRSYYNDGLSNKNVIAFLSEENRNIVAMSMMCFCNVVPSLFNLDGKIAFITDMYTIPEYRNKGLGMNLLNNIMEYAKKLGCSKVILNATDSGRALYEKYGFKDTNGEMSYKFT